MANDRQALLVFGQVGVWVETQGNSPVTDSTLHHQSEIIAVFCKNECTTVSVC